MATNKRAKIQAEIDKARAKLAEQQARVRELEGKRTEAENMEIVDIVRGLNIPLDNLAAVLQSIKGGTSGQVDPKLRRPKETITDKEEITE
jgi:phage terminase Nu1 subunit (DNA packaging protein)